MKQEVQSYIKQCVICQQTKYSTLKPSGLLQPLPIPNQIWEDISMDFITGLPASHGFTVIFVVVDRFTKGLHLGHLASGFTAYNVAELFVNIYCKLHGLPKSIVSVRDPVFISHFWTDLFKFSGTLLRMSSSYHPQTDGQTEVMNRTVEQYLRTFVHDKPSNWVRLLPWQNTIIIHLFTRPLGPLLFRLPMVDYHLPLLLMFRALLALMLVTHYW